MEKLQFSRMKQKARDECIVMNGEDDPKCKLLIEAHNVCLRKEGFDV